MDHETKQLIYNINNTVNQLPLGNYVIDQFQKIQNDIAQIDHKLNQLDHLIRTQQK